MLAARAAGTLLLLAPTCHAYARDAGGNAALVEPTREQYTYHLDDNFLLCMSAKLEHRLTAANASDAALLGFEDPELQLWLRTQAFMERLPERRRWLDVGCGEGRIVEKFGFNFEETTCLEADAQRIVRARKSIERAAAEAGMTPAPFVLYDTDRFLDFNAPGERYDALSSMMVIQHIPTTETTKWLSRMHTLLRPDGLLLLATTNEATHRLLLSTTYASPIEVNASVFDDYAYGRAGKANTLAVRRFDMATLRALVVGAGFYVCEHEPFAWWRDLGQPRPPSSESQYIIGAKRPCAELGYESGTVPSPSVAELRFSEATRRQLAEVRRMRAGGLSECA